MSDRAGVMYVVATPIGNLDDLSPRAVAVLSEVETILAEDTRHSAGLLARHRISTPLRAFHDHNERAVTPGIVARIESGARIALVSDAGTPLVSDPGFRLVRALRERDLEVVAVPGPCAVVAALSVAGLATDRFCFEGFLPSRSAARRHRLEALAGEARTLVFFEAPHRLAPTLADLAAVFGETREAAVARELTKIHESVRSGRLGELAREFAVDPARGEIVLVVAGASEEAAHRGEVDRLLRELLVDLPVKRAAALAARLTGAKRNALYKRALELAEDRNPVPGSDRAEGER